MLNSPLPVLGLRHRLAVFLVLVVAAALRFGGIGAGAPYRIGNDEPFVVGTALRIMQTGDFNPHFFDYGGLAIYLHTLVAVCRFLIGALDGQWTSLSQVWIGDYLTAARFVTAALGTLTVFVVYRVGLRLGTTVALMAAFVMAIYPQHVRESHFALTDTPLTLLVSLVLLLSLRATEQRRVAAVVTAAFVAGLAASVKYNGGVALLMPLIAAVVLPRGARLRGLSLALAGAAAGFILTSPYTVLDLPGFLNGFGRLSQSYTQGRPFFDAADLYVKYLRNGFTWTAVAPLSAGYAAIVLTLIGGALIARRRKLSLSAVGSVLILVFPCVWFIMLARQGGLQYGRYLLPMAPMLSVWLAAALVAIWNWSARRGSAWRWGARAALVAVIALPAGAAASWVRDHGRPRTEELASAWIVREVPAGQLVYVEASALLLPPTVTARIVPRLVERPLERYVELGAKYLVTTAALTDDYTRDPVKYAEDLAAYRELIARTEPVATFLPNDGTLGPRISILRIRP